MWRRPEVGVVDIADLGVKGLWWFTTSVVVRLPLGVRRTIVTRPEDWLFSPFFKPKSAVVGIIVLSESSSASSESSSDFHVDSRDDFFEDACEDVRTIAGDDVALPPSSCKRDSIRLA